jgi:hypothetical protein
MVDIQGSYPAAACNGRKSVGCRFKSCRAHHLSVCPSHHSICPGAIMSKKNGDKARFNRLRKKKIERRARIAKRFGKR